MCPPSKVRFKDKGLNTLYDLEKWKTSVFPCSITRPNYSRREDMML